MCEHDNFDSDSVFISELGSLEHRARMINFLAADTSDDSCPMVQEEDLRQYPKWPRSSPST